MRLFSKDKKSLQFPANCDGYLRVPYSSSAQQQVGIFGHSGSFTFEAIITPYDVNGNSNTSFNGTIKSLGQGAIGLDYMANSYRLQSEMVIFYNPNVKVVLENTTQVTSNQPAEYAIKFYLTIGSTTTTLTSDTVIFSTLAENSSLDPTNYRYDNHTPTFQKYDATVSVNAGTGTVTVSNTDPFNVLEIPYTSAGNSLGLIGIDTSTKVLTFIGGLTSEEETIIGSDGLWHKAYKDALYVNKAHHIAVSYNAAGGRMNIFYEGNLVASGVHGAGGNFSMASSDINIGQQSDAASGSLIRRSQFMGEMHEMVFLNRYKKSIGSIETLNPFFSDVLLYFDFEEVNLNG